jgi:hypothetical protein
MAVRQRQRRLPRHMEHERVILANCRTDMARLGEPRTMR